MLKLIPRRLLSWDFSVTDGSSQLADMDVSLWREKGTLIISGSTYTVRREGMVSGVFLLELAGQVLARAEKPSAMRRMFVVGHGDRHYTLRAASLFRRKFVLLDGEMEVGSICPDRMLSRRATISLPEEIPLPVRIFMIWLTVILWKRASGKGGG